MLTTKPSAVSKLERQHANAHQPPRVVVIIAHQFFVFRLIASITVIVIVVFIKCVSVSHEITEKRWTNSLSVSMHAAPHHYDYIRHDILHQLLHRSSIDYPENVARVLASRSAPVTIEFRIEWMNQSPSEQHRPNHVMRRMTASTTYRHLHHKIISIIARWSSASFHRIMGKIKLSL